jgi:hypothetical protein
MMLDAFDSRSSQKWHGVSCSTVCDWILLRNLLRERTSVHLPPTYESDKRSTQIGIQDAWYPVSLTFYCHAEKKVECAL